MNKDEENYVYLGQYNSELEALDLISQYEAKKRVDRELAEETKT